MLKEIQRNLKKFKKIQKNSKLWISLNRAQINSNKFKDLYFFEQIFPSDPKSCSKKLKEVLSFLTPVWTKNKVQKGSKLRFKKVQISSKQRFKTGIQKG